MRANENIIIKGRTEKWLLEERERKIGREREMAAATAAAAVDKPGNEQSFSPVHIYQEVVGYTKPKNEKGRAGSSAPRPPFLPNASLYALLH